MFIFRKFRVARNRSGVSRIIYETHLTAELTITPENNRFLLHLHYIEPPQELFIILEAIMKLNEFLITTYQHNNVHTCTCSI